MKKNLKIYTLAAALLLMLLLCACGGKEAAETPEPTLPPEVLPTVRINELMASNKSCLADSQGLFPDWAELYNYGTETASLSGCSLSDSKSSWEFPDISLEPGAYLLIFCSKEPGEELRADFSLSSEGENVSLISERGTLIDSISYTDAGENMSIYRDEQGNVLQSIYASPGFENSEAGCEAFQSSLSTGSPLVINEAMSYNAWFPADDGSFCDWVELKNVSSSPLELSQYFLSDSGSDRAVYRLPEYSLSPGECYVLYCDERFGVPFSLNAMSDELFLSFEDGSLCDYMSVQGLKYGGSCGRLDGQNGRFYFEYPSPGSDNYGGCRLIAEKPAASEPGGIYENVSSVSVELSSSGSIHYTLDGTLPTEDSPVFDSPIVLDSTAVIRAVNYEEGRLPSEVLDLSYIINEGHSLPVVSLVSDPDNIFGEHGVYSHPTADWERPGSVTLFDGDKGFSIECGMKMHGATSRVAQAKKSFKLNFRSRYEGQLNYDLFENGVTEFASVLLRAAQEDAWSTQMRDICMHNLAEECCPSLPKQDYKYCVLYINGEYWGLYALREAHSPTHYANHYGYDADKVSMWKEIWGENSSPAELYQFLINNDMTVPENYHHVAEHLDIESFIAWNIIQTYSGNLDVNSPNVRFYYSPEDDMMRIALVDLDLSMYPLNSGFEVPYWSTYGYAFNNYIRLLMDNEEYQQQFLTQLTEYLTGPLDDEHVLAEIDRLADEIRPEIPRDYTRWGGNPEQWENYVDGHLRQFVTCVSGRRVCLAQSISEYISLSPEEYAELRGD